MTDRLANPGRQERPGDAEDRRQDEAARIIRSRRQNPRDDAGNETDDDDPDDAAHVSSPQRKLEKSVEHDPEKHAPTRRVCIGFPKRLCSKLKTESWRDVDST